VESVSRRAAWVSGMATPIRHERANGQDRLWLGPHAVRAASSCDGAVSLTTVRRYVAPVPVFLQHLTRAGTAPGLYRRLRAHIDDAARLRKAPWLGFNSVGLEFPARVGAHAGCLKPIHHFV
jgi:hypothetical protein